jgi:hypothetical protein
MWLFAESKNSFACNNALEKQDGEGNSKVWGKT